MTAWQDTLQGVARTGNITQALGLQLIANGPPEAFIGELCEIRDHENRLITQAQVVGFSEQQVHLMPLSSARFSMHGTVIGLGKPAGIYLDNTILGRILDAQGHAIDEGSPLRCTRYTPLTSNPISPLHRKPIEKQIFTGVHAIDHLIPVGYGQRMGIFAGSGVGKSALLGMIARSIRSDVNVIALIGERGREVLDFVYKILDAETLSRTVIIAACSDTPPLMRRQAADTAATIAEFFAQQGLQVCLFMDSITRIAMAQREIGFSLGETANFRGYTPSAFACLPPLLERTGCFKHGGSITAFYTVLVEGDDFNEPVADTMRALLDGHIVLTRTLAHRGYYPAIDILQSLSRLQRHITSRETQHLTQQVVDCLQLITRNQDLIDVGAYEAGRNPALDKALTRIPLLEKLLQQDVKASPMPFVPYAQALESIFQ